MAESEEPDEENPFSIKKFVEKREKTKKTTKSKPAAEDGDIFDIFDAPAPTKREKPKLLIDSLEDSSEDKTPVKAKKEENPFSFKKFLKTGSSTEKAKKSTSSPDLPDISLSEVPTLVKSARAQPLIALQDDDDEDNSDKDGSEDLLNFVTPPPKVSLEDSPNSTLPDFLPEGAVRTRKVSKGARREAKPEHSLPDLSALGTVDFQAKAPLQVPLGSLSDEEDDSMNAAGVLIPESSQLKSQLAESEKEVQSLKKRVAELEKLLKQQKRKEVEETAEMERVVQQVEANLVMATQRAVKAENQAEKLKVEVKALQVQNASLQAQLLQPADTVLGEIRERATYASQELAAAASTADASLRQLLGGVDKLRLLSQVLATVDKITAEPKS